MTQLSNTTASRLIASLVVPADRDPLGLINPASIRPGCKCEHCRWQRGLITGVEEPAPTGPGVPRGWLARSDDAARNSQQLSDIAYIESKYSTDPTSWAVNFEQRWSDAASGIFGPYGV